MTNRYPRLDDLTAYNYRLTMNSDIRISWAFILAAIVFMCIAGIVRKPLTMCLVLTGSSFLGTLALTSTRQQVAHSHERLRDFAKIKDDREQDKWFKSLTYDPAHEVQQGQQQFMQRLSNAEPVRFAKIEDCWNYAHNMICARTDSGKTTLAEYLVSQLINKNPATECVIINIHHKVGDWPGVPVVGAGADYQAIANFLGAVVKEQDRRIREAAVTGKDRDDFTPLVIIFDEITATSIALRDVINQPKLMKTTMPLTLTQGRKYNVNWLIAGHSYTAPTLGLEGNYDVSECLNMIYLADQAMKHRNSSKDKRIAQIIEQQDRLYHMAKQQGTRSPAACLMNGEPVQIPDLTNFRFHYSGKVPAFMANAQAIATPNNSSAHAWYKVQQFWTRKGNQWITASEVKAGMPEYKTTSTAEIRELFKTMADANFGHYQETPSGNGGTVGKWKFK